MIPGQRKHMWKEAFMNYYFAPMEGLTDSIYRRLHHKYFGGVDRYYMPFLSPTVHRSLTPRETRELPRADSEAFFAVPQLLTKVPEDFLWAAGVCRDLGYTEVNLNTGCPSGTVTAKGKGAGMLRDPDELDRFLDEVFSKTPLPISIKTRIGFSDPEEFVRLLDIFNHYPVTELTVHPRVRTQFYKGSVDKEVFHYCTEHAKMPLCYNGNLCTKADIAAIEQEFSGVQAVMLGRGLVADPGMLLPGGTTREALEAFLEDLFDCYRQAFGSDRNAMFRLKENWHLLLCMFEGSEKLGKQLRKTTDTAEYRAIVRQILHTLPMRQAVVPDWDV